ncbi:hypothetical protein RA307_06515 [Xanthobacteraceae bacterium Astr-EGSB]|uniref:hypothetical protein n=1 Tax=Astrobacterium formosum TaxID=3069710 RepID=UPI0027B37419|nr:hypothetical protein [Xanthobacteraceae bacterium Astr-EGSB]
MSDHDSLSRQTDDPWMAAMRRGDFASAWRISDANLCTALARGEPAQVGPRHFQRVWNGEPLAGRRVLVRCYHGLGDTIQFIRFAAPLRRLAAEVIVWAQPALLSTVASAVGVDRALPLHDGTPDVTCDVDIEVMELAHALRVDACTIATPVPYIRPPCGRPRSLPRADTPIVGLVWQAGNWNPQRSMPAGFLAPLADVVPIRIVSMQCGPAAAEASHIPAPAIGTDDVEVTAETLRRLDLLITVDTFLAHLAGALGVPVWLLLARDCDWRWMEQGESTVWYPTMRLFRQPRAGDWLAVVRDVLHALHGRFGESATAHSEQTIVSDVRPE